MLTYSLSTLLLIAGLCAAAGVLVCSIPRLPRLPRRFAAYAPVACLYGGAALRALLRQYSGVSCAMTPPRALLLYGLLLAAHLYFLWDAVNTPLPPRRKGWE